MLTNSQRINQYLNEVARQEAVIEALDHELLSRSLGEFVYNEWSGVSQNILRAAEDGLRANREDLLKKIGEIALSSARTGIASIELDLNEEFIYPIDKKRIQTSIQYFFDTREEELEE